MDEENSLEKLINKDQLELIKQYIDQEVEKKLNKVNPTGSGAVSIGRKADTIVGTNSIVLGTDGEAESKYSISIGKENVAGHNKGFRISGDYAVAIGDENKTYGENSVSIGSGNTAYGHNEVNIGTNNYIEKPTTLLGGSDQSSYSVAVGSNNTIRASYSSIIGNNNESYYDKTTVLGNYNEDKNIALSVGIGTSDDDRKNGLELDWSGNLATAGDITNGNGVSLDDCSIIDSTSIHSFIDPRYLYAEDVINDLTHTDTNVPLSANQGKVLNDSMHESMVNLGNNTRMYRIGNLRVLQIQGLPCNITSLGLAASDLPRNALANGMGILASWYPCRIYIQTNGVLGFQKIKNGTYEVVTSATEQFFGSVIYSVSA